MKPKKTLHDAILVVLKDANNEWTELEAIANAVNEKKLYVQKNGQPVTVDQVKARTLTQAYKQQFEQDENKIRLRDEKRNDRKGNIVS
jgi:nucleosome binding factor SPN SPT16 subunit